MVESSSLYVVCVKECHNEDYVLEFNLDINSYKFTPGEKYLYHNCVKKKYNFIYDMNYNYYGCVTKDFIDKNFVKASEYNNLQKDLDEIDSLFDIGLHEER